MTTRRRISLPGRCTLNLNFWHLQLTNELCNQTPAITWSFDHYYCNLCAGYVKSYRIIITTRIKRYIAWLYAHARHASSVKILFTGDSNWLYLKDIGNYQITKDMGPGQIAKMSRRWKIRTVASVCWLQGGTLGI